MFRNRYTVALIVAFLSAVLVSGCAREDMLSASGNRILFRVNVDGGTRAIGTTTLSLGSFKVQAVRSDGSPYFNTTVDVVSGECRNYGNYNWPDEGAVDFYAYGPAACLEGEEAQVHESLEEKAGVKFMQFEIVPADTASAQYDFVFDKETAFKEDVSFRMHHAQSQIRLRVRSTRNQLAFRIYDWGVKYVSKSGTMVFSSFVDTTAHGPKIKFEDWTCADPQMDPVSKLPQGYVCPVGQAAPCRYAGTAVQLEGATAVDNGFILIPQTVTGASSGYTAGDIMDGAYLFVRMDILNNDDAFTPVVSNTVCCWPLEDIEWTPGMIYNYVLDLSEGGYYETQQDDDPDLDPVLKDSKITLAKADVAPWEEEQIEIVISDSVDFSKVGRANCYILNPPYEDDHIREFRIPVDRVNEFWGGNGYEDVPGYTIGPDTRWEADILWCDFDTTGVFRFTRRTGVGPDDAIGIGLTSGLSGKDNGGNAVIAIRCEEEEGVFTPVLWSWHLWITGYCPDEAVELTAEEGKYVYGVTDGAVHRYNNDMFASGGLYEDKFVMDRNIGDYADHNFIDSGRGQLYYQFGRKDPFPADNVIWMNRGNGVLVNEAWSPDEFGEHSESTGFDMQNVPYSVNFPMVFLFGRLSGDYFDAWHLDGYYSGNDDIRWNDPKIQTAGGKSIFDPCPPGWRLPECDIWKDFELKTAETYDRIVMADDGFYYYPNGVGNTSTGRIYYPGSSTRSSENGLILRHTDGAYCWSCNSSSTATALLLDCWWWPGWGKIALGGGPRAQGCPARAVQE